MAKHQGRHPARKGRAHQGRKLRTLEGAYQHACKLAAQGKHEQAARLYQVLREKSPAVRLQALIESDLAALRAAAGDAESARSGFEAALAIDQACEPARLNLALLEADRAVEGRETEGGPLTPSPSPPEGRGEQVPEPAVKVAILSFLFNWPSTGGGIVHTVELAQFLGRAEYEVKHFYARYPEWGVGKVEGSPPFSSEGLDFDATTWTMPHIQERFRHSVDAFRPDYVIVTDSWNSKPLLAEAVRGYPYILRFQALECLCPLNNVRLLPDGPGRFRQCHLHQLASPEECCRCLWERGRYSGSLHQAERELCNVGTRDYYERLVRAFGEAEAVLVVNPLMEAMISPYAKCVKVVTAGMDPARFPWPWPEEEGDTAQQTPSPLALSPQAGRGVLRILFAGLVDEPMKGFEVLHQACELLWQRRQDFELVATGDPPGRMDSFTRFTGWQSQDALPHDLRSADIFVFPTIAQEALGRTAVEAMAVGRPVVASRIGGLPFTVADGATGLLCEPGDPADLAQKIEVLLDDPALRESMGACRPPPLRGALHVGRHH